MAPRPRDPMAHHPVGYPVGHGGGERGGRKKHLIQNAPRRCRTGRRPKPGVTQPSKGWGRGEPAALQDQANRGRAKAPKCRRAPVRRAGSPRAAARGPRKSPQPQKPSETGGAGVMTANPSDPGPRGRRGMDRRGREWGIPIQGHAIKSAGTQTAAAMGGIIRPMAMHSWAE